MENKLLFKLVIYFRSDFHARGGNMSVLAEKVTQNATLLLMLAVILFFIRQLYMVDAAEGLTVLGTGIFAGDVNMIYIEDLGTMIDPIDALFAALINLFAGLSFAAVCFDEEKNIWFRVVAVAALMLIMFGGLNVM